MKTTLLALCAALLSQAAPAQNAAFGHAELNAGIHLIQAEVAANNEQRMQGLMFRERMAQNAGMVFVFDQPATQCMWMKNTLLPLSVAFIDAKGVIINIEDMAPQTLDSHCSAKPAAFALEMNLGWFAQHHIAPGTPIGGLVKR